MSKLIAPAVPGWPDITRFEVVERLLGGDGGPLNRAPLELLERTEHLKKQIDDAVSGALTVMVATTLKTARTLSMSGDGTWSVSFDGSADRTAALTLSKTGIAAGSYPVLTVDAKGRAVAGRALVSSDLPDSVALAGAPTTPTPEAGANDTRLANTEFVRGELAALVGSSPAALDTLNELAAALGNDPSFATTITKALAAKAPLAGSASPFTVGEGSDPAHAVQLQQLTAALALLQSRITPPTPAVRQTVISGAIDAQGRAAYLSTGAGLQPQLLATAVAVRLAFARGANDDIETVAADASWPALPANRLSYLYAQRASAGVVTLSSTLAPPQYDYRYPQATQLLLHFDGTNGATATTDDFGNLVVLSGAAQLDTSVSTFGTSSLKLNGTTDYAKVPSITAVPNGSWSIRGWFNPTSVAGTQTFFNLVNAAGFGLSLEMSSAKTFLYLSSTGSSWDLANGTAGVTALSVGTPYFIEITFDAVAGKYFIYVNGALDQIIASPARICAAPISLIIGAITYSATNTFFAGHVDEFELLPYCDHPGGTAYAVPTAAKSVATAGYASDWYSISEGILYRVTGPSTVPGSNPVLSGTTRLYIGEASAGAQSLSSVTAYAYNGRYDSGLFAAGAGTAYSRSHNLGTTLYNCDVTMADDAAGANERKATDYYYTGSVQIGYIGYGPTNRNVYSLFTGAGGIGTGSSGGTAPSGYYRLRVRRAF